MKWNEVYQLPLHNQELSEGHVLTYAWSKNGTMALMFERNVSQEDRKKLVNVINGEDESKIENVFNIGAIIMIGDEKLLTVRGWGNLTGSGGLNLKTEEAFKIQDEFIKYVVNRLKGTCI